MTFDDDGLRSDYDYSGLVRRPRVFAFFVGWFSEFLLIHTHRIRILSESGPAWEECHQQALRLLLLLRHWSIEKLTEEGPPKQLVDAFGWLAEAYGPTGYRVSDDAINDSKNLDYRHLRRHDSERFFPDLQEWEQESPRGFRRLCNRLHRGVKRFGRVLQQKPAVEAGIAVCGLSWAEDPRALMEASRLEIDRLLRLDLIPLDSRWGDAQHWRRCHSGDPLERLDWDSFESGFRSADQDRRRLERRLLARRRKLMQYLPEGICRHAGLAVPPLQSDVRMASDDLSIVLARLRREPPVVLGETKDVAPLVRGSPKPLLTKKEFSVVKRLIDAGSNGCKLYVLETVAGSAREILRRLRKDPDWAAVVHMPGIAYKGYRIAWPNPRTAQSVGEHPGQPDRKR